MTPRASVETLRRSEIVDGAIRLIARKGYEATTMRGLAAELDVSTGTITHWFATKNQVLGATLEELAASGAQIVVLCRYSTADMGTRSHFLSSLCAAADRVYQRSSI